MIPETQEKITVTEFDLPTAGTNFQIHHQKCH